MVVSHHMFMKVLSICYIFVTKKKNKKNEKEGGEEKFKTDAAEMILNLHNLSI